MWTSVPLTVWKARPNRGRLSHYLVDGETTSQQIIFVKETFGQTRNLRRNFTKINPLGHLTFKQYFTSTFYKPMYLIEPEIDSCTLLFFKLHARKSLSTASLIPLLLERNKCDCVIKGEKASEVLCFHCSNAFVPVTAVMRVAFLSYCITWRTPDKWPGFCHSAFFTSAFGSFSPEPQTPGVWGALAYPDLTWRLGC